MKLHQPEPETLRPPPPPPVKSLHSPKKKFGKPDLPCYYIYACLTQTQWNRLTAWCMEHHDFLKKKSTEDQIKAACQDRPISRKLIDSNSIAEAMKLAAYRLKTTPTEGSTDDNNRKRK